MVPVIDVDAKGLASAQIHRLVRRSNGVLLRSGGKVISHIEVKRQLGIRRPRIRP